MRSSQLMFLELALDIRMKLQSIKVPINDDRSTLERIASIDRWIARLAPRKSLPN